MRRLLVRAGAGGGAAALAVAGALTLAGGERAGAAGTYRVDAIFDTAKGLIPGQLVKIAGARAGTVKDVSLTPDHKARIALEVDARFAPFRSDAACSIQPEGLISENFVQCDPGTPAGEPLEADDGLAPTVPLERNATPVGLSDLFQVWQTPVRERLSIVLAALGGGAAARGEDINEILRRASPTLRLTRKAVSTLNEQRSEIKSLIADSDELVAQLARRRTRVGDFIDQAARVTAKTAARDGELAESVARLPALLDATEPALRRLEEIARDGRPVLADLREAAPEVDRLLADAQPFAAAGLPAVRRLGAVSQTGIDTARDSRRLVSLLRKFARRAGPTVEMLREFTVDLRDRGGVEYLLRFAYGVTAAGARYDATSHFVPSHLMFNRCSGFANSPTPGCSANYNPSATTAPRRGAGDRAPAARRPARAPSAPRPAPAPRRPSVPRPQLRRPQLPDDVRGIARELERLIGGAIGLHPDRSRQEGLLAYLLG